MNVKEHKDEQGYTFVYLEKNGKKHKAYVHELVYTSFIGAIPEGFVVSHIDGNKSNNRADNLCLVPIEAN
jgi:hypothetical protein